MKNGRNSDKRSWRLIEWKLPNGVGVIREPGFGRGLMSLPPTMLPFVCVCVCVYIYERKWEKTYSLEQTVKYKNCVFNKAPFVLFPQNEITAIKSLQDNYQFSTNYTLHTNIQGRPHIDRKVNGFWNGGHMLTCITINHMDLMTTVQELERTVWLWRPARKRSYARRQTWLAVSQTEHWCLPKNLSQDLFPQVCGASCCVILPFLGLAFLSE